MPRELRTLEVLDDGETLLCGEHEHKCRFVWVAFRAVLEELKAAGEREHELTEQLEAALREINLGKWTH